MHWWNGGWDWGWGLVMLALSVGFWAFVIWAVLMLVRVNRPTGTREPEADPERILARRFAAGGIDEDEYRQRLEVLRGAPAGPEEAGWTR